MVRVLLHMPREPFANIGSLFPFVYWKAFMQLSAGFIHRRIVHWLMLLLLSSVLLSMNAQAERSLSLTNNEPKGDFDVLITYDIIQSLDMFYEYQAPVGHKT